MLQPRRKTEDYISSVVWNRFLPVPGLDKRRLTLNLEGAYSLTPHHVSQAMIFEVSQIMQQHWQRPLVACSVLEGFAGQGGDTTALLVCAKPHTIYAVEYNVSNFNNLVTNVTEYQRVCVKPSLTTVHFIRENVVDLVRKHSCQHFDVVYMDPPWGGPMYRKQPKLVPLMVPHSSTPTLAELAAEVLPRCKLLVLKVPVGFDTESLCFPRCALRTTVYDDKIRFVYVVNLTV